MALNALRYAAVESLRGDMGWSTFRERLTKATLRYKIRLERMDDTRLARQVYLWNGCKRRWAKRCMKVVEGNGLNLWWMYEMVDDRERMSEWKTLTTDREGLEWDVKKWKNEIDRVMKQVGLNRWKNDTQDNA